MALLILHYAFSGLPHTLIQFFFIKQNILPKISHWDGFLANLLKQILTCLGLRKITFWFFSLFLCSIYFSTLDIYLLPGKKWWNKSRNFCFFCSALAKWHLLFKTNQVGKQQKSQESNGRGENSNDPLLGLTDDQLFQTLLQFRQFSISDERLVDKIVGSKGIIVVIPFPQTTMCHNKRSWMVLTKTAHWQTFHLTIAKGTLLVYTHHILC